nr:unnamed protein product [Callosobruchus chinensis]
MDISVMPSDKNKGETPRKKVPAPNTWKRAQAKNSRYAPKGFPAFPSCNHIKGALLCRLLTSQDIRRFHAGFYKEHDKIYQDNFILKHISMTKIKRRRPKNHKNVRKEARTKYFIRNLNKELVPVCLNTFQKALNVSRFRINRIAERFYYRNEMPKERRGGDTTGNRFMAKKESIKKFINRLQCSETHYCTNTSGRKYLPAELNIKKLWRMYQSNVEDDLKVKESYFRYIFNRFYNLGFGTPRVDVCSTCLSLTEKIKSTTTEGNRSMLLAEKRVHKLRAKAFYSLLQEEREDLLILSFDCQKNQPLPKLPDQSCYYTRQLYLYNFSVVRGHSKSKLNKDNVTAYTWTENEFAKGANEISSCLYDCLNSIDMTPYKTVRLICDGCGGQNKNSILISMVCSWFVNAPDHREEIQLIFPITGHSFIPPDRVFGNVEKEVKQREIIVNPNEYINIISNSATVKKLGEDVVNLNWKCEVQKYIRIVKRGRSLDDIRPVSIAKGNSVTKEQKKVDVNSLLVNHYGDAWRQDANLDFFKHVIDDPEVEVYFDGEETCEPLEETPIHQGEDYEYEETGTKLREQVKNFLIYFRNSVNDGLIFELQALYEHTWPKLTEEYFDKRPWPDPDEVAAAVGNDYSFAQYRARLQKKTPQELQNLNANNKVWNILCVLNVLHSLVDKSNIKQQLEVYASGGDPDSVAGEYGRHSLYKMFGYFSLIGLLRLHSLMGDYYQAIKVLENIEVHKKSQYAHIPACQISTSYYVGFAYMMMRRYSDAIRTFSSILLYVQRTKQLFASKTYQHDQINKQTEQMYHLLAICLVLHPQCIDESIQQALREQMFHEKMYKMQCGDLKEFEACFVFACPKFLAPYPPAVDSQPNDYSKRHRRSLISL